MRVRAVEVTRGVGCEMRPAAPQRPAISGREARRRRDITPRSERVEVIARALKQVNRSCAPGKSQTTETMHEVAGFVDLAARLQQGGHFRHQADLSCAVRDARLEVHI